MLPSNNPYTEADIEFVIRELSNYTNRQEVKQALMVRRGLSWNAADELVSYVEQNYSTSVATRQAPLQIFLGAMSLIGGIALISYAGLRLLLGIPISPLAMRNLVVSLVTGILMVGGSLLGFWQTFRAIFK